LIKKACLELEIQLKNTPNAFTLPVADTIISYMLAFARRQPWMDREMKMVSGIKSPDDPFQNAHWESLALAISGRQLFVEHADLV